MVIVIVTVSFVLVGCDVTADDPHGLVEKDLKLSDGRTVICVQNDRGIASHATGDTPTVTTSEELEDAGECCLV